MSTASAWTSATIKYWPSDGEKTAPFKKIGDNDFRILITPKMFNNSDFCFRFVVDGTEWGLWKDATEDYLLDTSNSYGCNKDGNMSGAKSLKIASSENTDDYVVIVKITWNDPKWTVSYYKRAATTFDIRFVKPNSWGNDVKLYAYDSDGVEMLGAWRGESMTKNGDGTFSMSIKAPSNEDTKVNKIIFNDGTNQTPGSDGYELSSTVYDSEGVAANQTVSAGSNGVATYSSAYPLDFSSTTTITAYTVSSLSPTAATLTEVKKAIPAETGLIIMGANDASEDISPSVISESVGTNFLQASVTGTTVAADYAYVLSAGAFHPADAGTIPANRAYLLQSDIVNAGGGHARSLSLTFGDEETGISQVSNDQWIMGNYYDFSGRRVAQPTKGLYIVNGKKVIVK